MKVLAITNLFGYPWDPSRGVFNQQQFDRLARQVNLSVLVAVPWLEAVRRPMAYWRARAEGRKRWPYVDYFVFWYVPGAGQSLHALFFLMSLLLQRPATLLMTRWHALIGSWGFPDAVAAAALGKLTRTPVLMKVHGTDINDYLQVPGKRWQILAAARHSHAVMCASGALRDLIVGAGIAADKVDVIYNGVDGGRFVPADRSAARAELGMPGFAPMLLYIGNLKLAKGCVDLLDAFIAVAPLRPDLLLVFVGGGGALGAMQQRAAAAGVSERVRFIGKVDHALLPRWLAASSLLCLPSHNEGVPNVVLEAMSCGVPVVATSVGGIPEVVPAFAGTLVPPRDTAALAAALDDALQRDWDAGRITAHASRFSWDANVESVVQLLDRSHYSGVNVPKLP